MDRAAETLSQTDRDLYTLLREGRSATEIATMTTYFAQPFEPAPYRASFVERD